LIEDCKKYNTTPKKYFETILHTVINMGLEQPALYKSWRW